MDFRYKIEFLLLVIVLPLCSFPQRTDSLFYHPDRYRLDLPKEWNRPKLIEAVTDVLSQTIDELKNRDFSTEGKAAYYVKLVIDSLIISNQQTSPPIEIGSIPHYTFSFNYNFNAALLVSDSMNKPVSSLRLVSAEETMTYTRQFSTLPQNAVYRYETVYNNLGRPVGRRLVQEAPPVNTYIPRIDPFSVITPAFLMNICEKKIYEIRKLLKKLNQE
ncbi:MAG: hypothetical protein HZB42_05330 [Sphingobacteriales bacterium]|nr:hypothetical protein [Sphingobacteriales bacterium]